MVLDTFVRSVTTKPLASASFWLLWLLWGDPLEVQMVGQLRRLSILDESFLLTFLSGSTADFEAHVNIVNA